MTSNAQYQDPIHLNIDNELYENNDDDEDIASHSDNELLPGRDTPYSPPLSDNDEHELLPGRDTPYSPTISEKIDEYDSDANDNDLDGQGPEIIPCTEGQEQYNISYLCRNETFSSTSNIDEPAEDDDKTP